MNQICTSPLQKAFLKRAVEVVDARISDQEFTVEMFSRFMKLSRSQLFRRIKAATNASVSVFIRQRRLEYAVRLLKAGELPVARVAVKVGFSGETYFRKCFKEAYGVTPGEYMRTGRINDFLNAR